MDRSFDEYSDAELFYLLSEKDRRKSEKAFAELYARHASRVYAYCRRFLGNKEEAQDVFQETFVRFHQSAGQDRIMTNVPAFLLKIARNLCVNSKRREKKVVQLEDYMVPGGESSNDKNELLDLIRMAMDLIPEEYREMFILREYEGLSYNEISDVTGESLATVKVRIHRAKQKIREILAPYMKEMTKFE